ncbi:hypothetical protein BJ508DRAFT_416832 [Ascobolus immersus RN42]|uniref:Uncharacterized protein n=1 Tax=Ascobolus immersus RN42 TaxID=1160509 RepID=A0A3N4I1C9_ASCIM|nr:hypothetical protein BJ508DRAFT_416832 [Ascobolus immersus RN42]
MPGYPSRSNNLADPSNIYSDERPEYADRFGRESEAISAKIEEIKRLEERNKAFKKQLALRQFNELNLVRSGLESAAIKIFYWPNRKKDIPVYLDGRLRQNLINSDKLKTFSRHSHLELDELRAIYSEDLFKELNSASHNFDLKCPRMAEAFFAATESIKNETNKLAVRKLVRFISVSVYNNQYWWDQMEF